MKLHDYENQGRIGGPAVDINRVTPNHAGAMALAQQQAGTVNMIAKGWDNFLGEVQNSRIMAANNEYNDQIIALTNKLRENKEEAALNTVPTFETEAQKIQDRIRKKYGNYLYGEAGRKFESVLERDLSTHRQSMMNYQVNEAEKYKDTTLMNGVNTAVHQAMENYQDPEAVQGNLNRIQYMVQDRYQNYGPERVKEKVRTAMGGMAQGVINRAYANGDNDLAETYIERYGRALDPNVLNTYSKKVYDSRMALLEENTGTALFAQFGDDGDAAYNYIFSPEFQGNGNVTNSVAWMKDMSDRKQGWGEDTCTKGVNAALEAGGFKPISIWAPTAWKEEKTFTDKSQLRTGDIVYWESDDGGEPNHVGIYDAKTGKVYQSGTQGFAPISLDHYKVWGFSHPRGLAATPEEKKNMWNAYLERRSLNERIQADRQRKIKRQADAVENNAIQSLFKMQQDGVSFEEANAQIRQMVGMDYALGKKLQTAANYFWGEGGKPASQSTVADVTNMLADGKFRSREEYLEMAKNKGFSADQMRMAYKTYSQYEAGEGQFGYDLNEGIKQQVVGDMKENAAKQIAWAGVKPLLRVWIQQQLTETKRKPAVYEIVEKGRELIEKTPVGSVSEGRLFSTSILRSQADFERNGIKSYTKIDENTYKVEFSNGAVETMSAARFEEISR